jgi:hypothetical protein
MRRPPQCGLDSFDQPEIRFEPDWRASLDSTEVGMQWIEEVIDFGGNHRARNGEDGTASLLRPFRSDGLERLAGGDVAPVRRKIVNPDTLDRHRLRDARLDHHVPSPKWLVLHQHSQHGERL